MSRAPLLEENDFAAIRTILSDLYGEHFARADISPVDGGTFSYGYVLTTDGGRQAFFKLSSPGGEIKKDEYADTPPAFMEYLANHGTPVPKPFRDRNGHIASAIDTRALTPETAGLIGSHKAILSTMATGKHLPGNVVAAEGEESYADYAGQAGAVIGKIHAAQQSEPFTAPVPQKLGHFLKTKERMLENFGFAPQTDLSALHQQLGNSGSAASQHLLNTASRLRDNAERTTDGKTGATLRLMAEAIDRGLFHDIVRRLALLERQQDAIHALPSGICHGDCANQSNLLQDNKRITAIIDFDEMFHGPLLWDVNSLMVNSYTVTDTGTMTSHFSGDIAKKTLHAYEKERHLSEQELNMLPTLMEEYKLTHLSHSLKQLVPFMQSGNLSPEQLSQPVADFNVTLAPYRQLLQIGQIEETIQDYRQEKKTMDPRISYRDNWRERFEPPEGPGRTPPPGPGQPFTNPGRITPASNNGGRSR